MSYTTPLMSGTPSLGTDTLSFTLTRPTSTSSNFLSGETEPCHDPQPGDYRRIFCDFYGIQLGRVQVFPAQHAHARAGIFNKFSFLRFYYGCGWETPFVGRSEEGSFVRFFELVDILGKSPRVSAGASLLSFSLSSTSVFNFHSVGTALMRHFDLNFSERRTFVFSDVCMMLRSFLRIALVE